MFNYVSECDDCEVYAITIEDFWKVFILKYNVIGNSILHIIKLNLSNQIKILLLFKDFIQQEYKSINNSSYNIENYEANDETNNLSGNY